MKENASKTKEQETRSVKENTPDRKNLTKNSKYFDLSIGYTTRVKRYKKPYVYIHIYITESGVNKLKSSGYTQKDWIKIYSFAKGEALLDWQMKEDQHSLTLNKKGSGLFTTMPGNNFTEEFLGRYILTHKEETTFYMHKV